MTADLHVHTEFSCDSDADMEQYVKRAIERNIHSICFTDHVDMNENDYGYNYYSPERYFEKFKQVKEKYDSRIKIYAGIEFGEPHLYADKLKELSSNPYDYMIGSIHWIGDMFPCQKVREKYCAKEFYTAVLGSGIKCGKAGRFRCIGAYRFPEKILWGDLLRRGKNKRYISTIIRKRYGDRNKYVFPSEGT